MKFARMFCHHLDEVLSRKDPDQTMPMSRITSLVSRERMKLIDQKAATELQARVIIMIELCV